MFCISRRVRDGEKSLHRSPLLLTVTHRFTRPRFFLPGAGFWGIFFSPGAGYSVSAGQILNRKAKACRNSRSNNWEILCYRLRDGKKPGFFDFLPQMSADVGGCRLMNLDFFTADVGGCTLMDAD
jgi:hypothetical protein